MALSIIVMGAATAQSNQAVFVKTSEQDVYRLIVDTEDQSDVTFRIYSEKGKQIFKDKIFKVSGFIKPYNFQNLPRGLYKLEVEKNGTILEQEVIHNERHSAEQFSSLLVDLNQGENTKKFDLRVVGANNRPVTVEIKNSYGQTVYTDEVSGLMGFTRTYDLEKVGKVASFQVKVDNQIVTKSL